MVEKVELRNRLREEAQRARRLLREEAQRAWSLLREEAQRARRLLREEAQRPRHLHTLQGGSPSSSKAHQTQTASNPVLSGFTEASKCRQG